MKCLKCGEYIYRGRKFKYVNSRHPPAIFRSWSDEFWLTAQCSERDAPGREISRNPDFSFLHQGEYFHISTFICWDFMKFLKGTIIRVVHGGGYDYDHVSNAPFMCIELC